MNRRFSGRPPAAPPVFPALERPRAMLQLCYKRFAPLAISSGLVYIEHAEERMGEEYSPGQIRDRLATVCVPVCILQRARFRHQF